MGIFSKEKPKEERVIIFDIGSGSIGAAYLVRQKGANGLSSNPRILHVVRKNIPFLSHLDFVPLVQNMLGTIDATAKEIQGAHLPAPDTIECILAAPWYAAQTRVIHEKRHAPFIFSKKLWYELVMKEVSDFRNIFMEQYSELDTEPRVIERKNMHVSLNGYTSANPIGKKAKELELSVYISMVPEYIALSIEEIIGSYFQRPIAFSTFLSASYQVIRDIFISEHDYLLVDIGGEITDIGLVKDDVLSESVTFPKGKNFILRRIMHHSRVSYHEAESLFYLFEDNKLTPKMRTTLEPVIIRAKSDWTHLFQHTLAEILRDFSAPATIFLTVDSDSLNFFIEAIHNEQFTQSKLVGRNFNVILIEAKMLHEFCAFERQVSRDPFLMLESIFISKTK